MRERDGGGEQRERGIEEERREREGGAHGRVSRK